MAVGGDGRIDSVLHRTLRSIAWLSLAVLIATSAPGAQAPAIRIVLLGTGGGPNTNFDQAGPAAWVEAGSERLFVDVGRRAVSQMAQAKLPTRDVTRLFLTHLHSDHIVSLPDLWLGGWWMARERPLEVRGPAGTRAMTENLQEAFAADIDLRTGPPERLPRATSALIGIDVEEGLIYEANGVRVSAIRVDHGPVPTFGYRIDHAGRSVVFSGDDRRSENLIAKSQNVDVLFHNMTGFTPEQLQEQGRRGDGIRAAAQLLGTPEDAGAVFAGSRCKVAILIHSTRDPGSMQRIRAVYQGRLEAPDGLSEVLVGENVVVRPLER